MLEVRGIAVGYGLVDVLKNVDFAVAPGERIALFGANGSGKSTLLKCLSTQVWPSVGRVALDGTVVRTQDDVLLLRRNVGVVGQDPDNQMVASTLFDEVAFGPCNLELEEDAVRARVERALQRCGLEGMGRRAPEELSGGQRQRAALAGVLAMEPAYLLCDEPCSMLDPASRCAVMDILNEASRRGCGVVVATHELCDVLSFDRAVILEEGRVVWWGTPTEVLLDKCVRERACCNVSTGLSWLANEVLKGSKDLRDVLSCPMAHIVREGLVVAASGAAESKVSAGGFDRFGACCLDAMRRCDGKEHDGLRLQGVTHAYRSAVGTPEAGDMRVAVRDVSLTCEPGKVCAILGPTGSGKSTVAKMAAGLLRPDAGTAHVDGRDVVAGEVGYVFQRAEDQLFAATVLDDVAFGPRNQGFGKQEARLKAMRVLDRVDLDARTYASVSPFALSGGRMRRAAVAGVLAMEAEYVVFDEPTIGLDARGVRALGDVIANLTREGVGVIVVTHDVERAVAWSDRVVVLSEGAVVWQGAPSKLADNFDMLETAGLIPGAALTPGTRLIPDAGGSL